MKFDPKRTWQQACGENSQNHADICVRYGVILIGPGRFGRFEKAQYQNPKNGLSSKKITGITRFVEKVADGDTVVLRIGTSQAVAVGTIVGNYEHNEGFCDIDGWDLQHVRRVRWHWSNIEQPDELGTYAFKKGATTQKLTTEKALAWLSSKKVHVRQDIKLPSIAHLTPEKISAQEIYKSLFDNGVDGAAIERLSDRLGELQRLASWYKRREIGPSEHETVGYLVSPFLQTLGWTPQRMAIEWNWVDLALFQRLPRKSENLGFVVEAKKIHQTCLSAKSQAAKYAEKHTCKQVVVTDGLRYGIFEQHYNRFRMRAYLNIMDFRSAYPVYDDGDDECLGAAEAIWRMTPEYSL